MALVKQYLCRCWLLMQLVFISKLFSTLFLKIDFVFQRPRTEWVLNWPGQLVIAGCQTYWTAEVSEALEKADLRSYISVLLTQV